MNVAYVLVRKFVRDQVWGEGAGVCSEDEERH